MNWIKETFLASAIKSQVLNLTWLGGSSRRVFAVENDNSNSDLLAICPNCGLAVNSMKTLAGF